MSRLKLKVLVVLVLLKPSQTELHSLSRSVLDSRDNVLTRAAQIYAGPSCSAVIDNQRTYWLAGKWKNTGAGGSGQGFMTFKCASSIYVRCFAQV